MSKRQSQSSQARGKGRKGQTVRVWVRTGNENASIRQQRRRRVVQSVNVGHARLGPFGARRLARVKVPRLVARLVGVRSSDGPCRPNKPTKTSSATKRRPRACQKQEGKGRKKRTRLVTVAGCAERGAVAHPQSSVGEHDELAHRPSSIERVLILPVDAHIGRHLRVCQERNGRKGEMDVSGFSALSKQRGSGWEGEGRGKRRTLTQDESAG